MCGRYVISSPRFHEVAGFLIREWMEREWGPERRFHPKFNIAPTQLAPVLRLARDGKPVMELLRWGLVPHWAQDSSKGPINARSETARTQPMFRDAFARRRCVVPASGFYEWQGERAPKKPWYIHPNDGSGFLFAGLWERRRIADDETLETYAILTTDANEKLRPLHERMPVILTPAEAERWIDPKTDADAARRLLRPAPDDGIDARRIGRRVNDVRNDEPSLIEPVADEEDDPPEEPTLFS